MVNKREKKTESQIRIGIAFEIIRSGIENKIRDKSSRINELLQQVSAIPWELSWYRDHKNKSDFFLSATYSSYIKTIGDEFVRFSNFISADNLYLYTVDKRLLIAYHKDKNNDYIGTYVINENNKDTFLAVDDYSRILINRKKLPINPLPLYLNSHLEIDIPEKTINVNFANKNNLGSRIITPVFNNGEKVGAIVAETYYTQEIVQEFAHLSLSEVNFFANNQFSIGTFPSQSILHESDTVMTDIFDYALINKSHKIDIYSISLNQQDYYQGVRHFFDDNNNKIGSITVSLSQNIEKANIQKLFKTVLLITLTAMIIALCLTIIISRKTLQAIRNLTISTSEIASGNLEHPINVNQNDEIGILAHSFTIMKDSIKKQIIKLRAEITEHKHTADELRFFKNYLSNIIDSMPSILIGVDSKGKITQWNMEAAKIAGISKEEAINLSLLEAFPRLASEVEQIEKSIATGLKKTKSKVKHKEENNYIYEDITIYPLISNGVEGAVIRIDDVTKEYEVERQLNHARKMDALGQLAGGIAHDFNNMIAGIIGSAQVLKLPKMNLNEEGLKFIDLILKTSKRASDLSSKLLAFGRKDVIDPTVIDIHKVVNDTFTLLNRTIDKKIKIEVIKNAENSLIIGDDSSLQNSLLNLGINASHAMKDGGRLLIETRNIYLNENYCNTSTFDIEPGEYCEIEVRDTGIGISQQIIKKIFEPFFTTKEQGKGTGLGLSSVYGTIQNHHGVINVYSELGIGTAFHLYLPCSSKVENEKKSKEIKFTGSGLILLVDDEEIIRTTGKYALEQMGFNVILAKNGLEAVEIFEKNHSEIMLVIMDMIMPVMNGKETFYKMKVIDSNCKVVISSGFTKDNDLKDLKKDGLSGFIKKPFRDFELTSLLGEILD